MIKSRHNVYPEFSDQIYERWKKTTVHAVAGWRLDPHKPDSRISFVLMSREDDFNFETRHLAFVYESEVVELYSERESRLFTSLNKAAIQSGSLVLHEEKTPDVDTSNALTDHDIAEILAIKAPATLKARLKKITAVAALNRIKAALTPEHKQWFSTALENRITDVTNLSTSNGGT